MTFSTRTWPANGGTAGSVVTSYGPRSTSSQYGGVLQDGVKKTLTLEFTAPATGMAAAAWAKNGLDVVIPAGSIFVKADVVVETAFDALTALTIGTYKASDGTTEIDADGLVAAAGSALATIDAVGDRLVGAGAQLATGTAGLGATLFDSVIRVLYTGSAPTVGKARLVVDYISPTP
jgi:hypothetical protein